MTTNMLQISSATQSVEFKKLKLDDPLSIGKAYRVMNQIVSVFNPGWYHIKRFDVIIFVSRGLVEEPKRNHGPDEHGLVTTNQQHMTVKYTFFQPSTGKHMHMYACRGTGIYDLANSLSLIQI